MQMCVSAAHNTWILQMTMMDKIQLLDIASINMHRAETTYPPTSAKADNQWYTEYDIWTFHSQMGHSTATTTYEMQGGQL